MGNYKATYANDLTVQLNNNFGTGGNIRIFDTNLVSVDTAEILNRSIHEVSADVSATAIPIAPFASDIGSASFLQLVTNHPVDVRLGDASNSPISNVKYLAMAGNLSGLFLTTGSLITTAMVTVLGGSNAVLTTRNPLPA